MTVHTTIIQVRSVVMGVKFPLLWTSWHIYTVEIGVNLLHTKGKSAGDKEQQVHQNDTPKCKCQYTL